MRATANWVAAASIPGARAPSDAYLRSLESPTTIPDHMTPDGMGGLGARKRSNSDHIPPLIFVLQMQNLDSIILFPVDRLLKTDFRGSKGDMKRPFDRSWKEYQDKYNELERQKKKLAKENGENKIRFCFPDPNSNLSDWLHCTV